MKKQVNSKKLINENGLSLIEILASIVILTIILISFMNFFPQMGQKNIQNEHKQTAINIAKIELDKWKSKIEESRDFNSFITNPLAGTYSFIDLDDYVSYNSSTKSIIIDTKSSNSAFNVSVVINTQSDLDSIPKKAYQIQVQIYKANNILVSETYGYLLYER